MREITTHQVAQNDLNMQLRIEVLDLPGQGGACHNYRITSYGQDDGFAGSCAINFQNGPVKEFGLNGISQEALLAVLIDRLEGFQSGEFACIENSNALSYLQLALDNLNRRTLNRIARGVEGTNQK